MTAPVLLSHLKGKIEFHNFHFQPLELKDQIFNLQETEIQ